jgi:hypothetical protein
MGPDRPTSAEIRYCVVQDGMKWLLSVSCDVRTSWLLRQPQLNALHYFSSSRTLELLLLVVSVTVCLPLRH